MRGTAIVIVVLALAAGLARGAQAGVRVGVEGGLNQAAVTRDPDAFDLGLHYRPAWSLGVLLEVPLARRLTLATGLRYLEDGELVRLRILESGTLIASAETHTVWRYLDLPIQVRLHLLPARGLFAQAGPEVGYLLQARATDRLSLARVPLSPATRAARPASVIFEGTGPFVTDVTGLYERWNVALAGGLGWEFAVGRHAGVAEARYAHGLADIARSGDLARGTRGFEALLGLLW